MKRLHVVILLISIFVLFISNTVVFSAIDPGSWYYDKTVNLATGDTARLYFPQASYGDNGEKDLYLREDPEDPNSVFENFFTDAQGGRFYLFYDGNDIVDEIILMVALGEEFDDVFSIGIQWRINDGSLSQSIPLDSGDFNSNEYGYYPQWWKVAQNGKPLISTGSDQDQYYVVYVSLGFDTEFMVYGDVLEIKYAISGFNVTDARLIFNVYGSEDGEDYFRWTNKNTNTFGVNGKAASSQQQIPSYFYPYLLPNIYYGQLWPGTAWGSGWGYSSPAGPYYGYSSGAPYSFLSGFYAGGSGYRPGGYYSNFGVYPLNSYYSSWSYNPLSLFNYSGFGYGGYSFGYGSYPFRSFYNPGGYYQGYYSRYF